MRANVFSGFVISVAAFSIVMIGSWLELELASVALLGVAVGAVIALVPDQTPLQRASALGVGFLIAWVGYVVRAASLPDSTMGVALAFAGVCLLAAVVATLSMGRLPLWGLLLGTAVFSGAYEAVYNAAPPELLSTSWATGSSLALTAAFGYVAALLTAPTSALNVAKAQERHEPSKHHHGFHLRRHHAEAA